MQKRPAPSRFGAPRHPGEGLRDACSGGMRHPFIGTVPTYQLRDEGLDRWPASSYRRPTPETLGSVLKRPWLEMPFRVFGTKAMRLFPCVDWCPLLSLPLSLSLSLSLPLSLSFSLCVCVCVCVCSCFGRFLATERGAAHGKQAWRARPRFYQNSGLPHVGKNPKLANFR